MKRLTLFSALVASVFFIAGCSSVVRLVRGPSSLERFQDNLDALLSDSIFSATKCGIEIISLGNGETLYERDADMLLRPASNMKLLTTSAALSLLGKQFSLNTRLYADTLITDSVEHGNIYIKGYGDPDFNSAQLQELLSTIRTRGIKRIEGNIIGDAGYFDNRNWGVGWMWDDEPFGFAAYNSPLSINRNCVEVTVNPGVMPGDSARVAIDPPTRYVSVENHATTAMDTIPGSIEISRKFAEKLNVITVNGAIPRNATPQKDLITVLNPELYFLTLAQEELGRQHIEFSGKLLLDSVRHNAVLLAQHVQPIDSMMTYLNKVSDNLSAENTLKILGAEQYGVPGTTQHGIWAVNRFLNNVGVDTSKFLMVDGSGVSHYNLLTPNIYIKLLRGMYSRKDVFDLFYSTLPNAGVDGSLETRMKNTPAQNNLHAKTGTISGVSSLAGYVRTADGEVLAFSMMMQNYIGSSEPYRKTQDAIGVLMAGFRRE